MAWYTDEDEIGLYEVYIGQNGGVKANQNSTKLFNYLINVKEIDLIYLDTSNVKNMKAMFQRCQELEKIIGLENFNTYNVENMQGMFSRCYKLQSVNVSSFDTSSVENMRQMFQLCFSLKEIDVSSFDTREVTDMGIMFSGGTVDDVVQYMQLERIVGIENFNTSNVTNMYCMFQMCSNLTTLDLSNWNTSNVIDRGYMFNVCSNLEELHVGNFITSKVGTGPTDNPGSMDHMFSNCYSLTELDISSFDTSNVKNMKAMFYGTGKLKPIYIGSNWQTAKTNNDMFTGSLTKKVEEMCGPDSVHAYCTLN